MSNDKKAKMEVMKNSSSNRSNNKDPGIYTCPTCNALFTCLKFYQQHVTQHAESNGTKLYCCKICRYSTEALFQFNWHQMSHKNALPHSCSVCQDKSITDSYNSNHINGRDNDVTTTKNTRKGQQNGKSNKKMKFSNNNKSHVKTEAQEDDDSDEDEEDSDADTDDESEESEEADNEDESGDSEDEEDDEEEEIDEEIDQSQLQNVNYQNASNNNNEANQEEISDDDDDDEEEEIESEEDNGDANELPEEYLVAQRLNNESGSGFHFDMQTNSNALNNSSTNNQTDQAPPYTKSGLPEIPADLINDGIICNKGKGKGNRKSRTINQMGGQLDDEMSQLRRKFHCSHCGKSFKTKSHLQRHILTHTGEKPYHCNRCGAKFNQSSSLRNHIIALHTKEYPHFCNTCQKGFLMPALLQKHLQTSHRD